VDGLGFVVLGEGSYSAAVVSCPASGQESERAGSGALVLSVRHKYLYYLIIINNNLINLYIINILFKYVEQHCFEEHFIPSSNYSA
jgi:hypothetical protein